MHIIYSLHRGHLAFQMMVGSCDGLCNYDMIAVICLCACTLQVTFTEGPTLCSDLDLLCKDLQMKWI